MVQFAVLTDPSKEVAACAGTQIARNTYRPVCFPCVSRNFNGIKNCQMPLFVISVEFNEIDLLDYSVKRQLVA